MKTLLNELYKPIESDLCRVDDIVRSELRSKDPFTSRLGNSLARHPGKRLRSALTIYSAYAVLGKDERRDVAANLARLAAGMELIHGAALVHDDVMDHAVSRRGRPSVNAGFGYEPAIAFGDYMFSKGIYLLAKFNNTKIVTCITQAALGMCEGELAQVLKRGDIGMKEQTYMTIIKKKTALLMSASCSSSMILIRKGERMVRSFSSFGLDVGIAFQIVDDCLDIIGTEKELGKEAGSDMRMGEMTLPLIYAREAGVKEALDGALRPENMSIRKKGVIREVLIASGSINKARGVARKYIDNARRELRCVEDSTFKKGLIGLTEHILGRLPQGCGGDGRAI